MFRVARWQYSGKSKQHPARSLARLNPDELRPALDECLKRGDCNFGGTKVCRPHLLRILMAAVKDATPKSIQLGQLVRQSLTFDMLVGLEELLDRTRHSNRCVLAGAEQALPGDHRRLTETRIGRRRCNHLRLVRAHRRGPVAAATAVPPGHVPCRQSNSSG